MRPTIKRPTIAGLVNATPLFKEERDSRFSALPADRNDPLSAHGSCPRAALPTDDHPIYLFERQPNICEFTAQTRQTEWNLAYHLAVELSALLPALNCDIDVLKRGYGYGNKRPDIIFHERGNHKSNFLVIELKRNGKPADIKRDIKKIREQWFRKPLRYHFGAAVNLRANGEHEVHIFENKP